MHRKIFINFRLKRRNLITCGIHVIIVGGGISNSQIITEEGKYSLDAIQNNPDIEGTLAYEIQELKTTSSIVTKNIDLHGVQIDTRSASGLYYKNINNFFTDNGIDVDKVVGVNISNWTGVGYIFNIYIGASVDAIGFMSQTSQTINDVTIRITYLK